MRIDIRGHHLDLSDELRTRAERRMRFALSRFGARVVQVTVQLEDINGPRGGIDKQCRVTVALLGAGHVRVEILDSDFSTAIDCAADRIQRAVARNLERHHATALAPAAPRRIPAATFFRRQSRYEVEKVFTEGGALS